MCTLQGLPVAFALTGAKADERDVLTAMLTAGAGPGHRPSQPDPHRRQELLRPRLRGRHRRRLGSGCCGPPVKASPPRAGAHLFKPLRQIIESVNYTFKGQLDLEQHGGHTPAGVTVRVLQRILALTAAIWHNDTTGQPVLRSLVAYDH